MTRMADPERPRDDSDYDDERFEDEGRRSIFSALWFRAILVVIVLGVVAAVAVPYVLELANQPAPKTSATSKAETSPPPLAPPAPPVVSLPPPAPPATEKPADKPATKDRPSTSEAPPAAPMPTPPAEKPAGAPRKSEGSKSKDQDQSAPASRGPRTTAPSPAGPASGYFVQVGAFKNP